jgi:hypothetical protein
MKFKNKNDSLRGILEFFFVGYDIRVKKETTEVISLWLVLVTGLERLLRLRLAYYSPGDPNSYEFRYPPTALR